jgi:hypothetical protein
MNGFEMLLNCAGEWVGPNRVQPFVDQPADEAPSRLTITPILNGTFVRLDQQWSWKGEPQLGCMLIGHSTVHWIDTWHNGERVMSLVGHSDGQGKLIAHESFPVKGEPDWGWRMEIRCDDAELVINMVCINPANGNEEGWVWTNLARVGSSR